MPWLKPAADGQRPEARPEARREFRAMGTVVTLRAAGKAAEVATGKAAAEIERLERLWSRFRPDSDVSRLNQADAAWIEVSPETEALITTALAMGEATAGAFDITGAGPNPGGLESDDGRFRLREGARVDLGGIAKGAAAQRAVAILADHGIASAAVSLGQSSVGVIGGPPGRDAWRIGIRAPGAASDQIVGALELSSGFLSTSGDYEASSIHGNHIVDPRTGRPADSGVRSATVVCPEGAHAEALSTALVVLGVEAGLALHSRLAGFEAVLTTADGRLTSTPGLRTFPGASRQPAAPGSK